jgi:hypothetical protein
VAVDEVRPRLRRKLEELVGVEEADLLMDRPPGGWSALVTKEWLDERLAHEREIMDERFRGIEHQFAAVDAKIDGLRHELVGTMHLEFRNQTWRLFGATTGLMAIVVAALRI